MNSTTGAEATAFSIACFVSADRNLEAIGENLGANLEAGRVAWRNAWRRNLAEVAFLGEELRKVYR